MSRYILIGPILLWLFAAALFVLGLLGTNIPSPIWWLASATCTLLGVWFAIRKDKAEQRRKQRRSDCELALKTLHHEIGNFKQLADAQKTGHTFVGQHKKAVEIYSFEITKEVLMPLARYWRYWWLANVGIREVQKNQGCEPSRMKLESLIRTLTSLRERLVSECKKESNVGT